MRTARIQKFGGPEIIEIAVFFLVDVTTERLRKIGELFDAGNLAADVGTVLPLDQARVAHEMLAGAPHARGKIVLNVAA